MTMSKRFSIPFFILTIIWLPAFTQLLGTPTVHSHNDYKQERPFWEAYEAGCGSIEVDVFLRNDSLFVAHEISEINSTQTLQLLYIEPIIEVLNNSHIRSFQLLIDVKTAAEPTLNKLILAIQQSPVLLTQKKVKFVISGNRPAPQDYDKYPSYIFFDHQSIENLDDISLKKVALISLPFYKTTIWTGKEKLPLEAEQKIAAIVETVHAKNLPFRFWATPDTQLSWKTMIALEVDFINTDKPKACSEVIDNSHP